MSAKSAGLTGWQAVDRPAAYLQERHACAMTNRDHKPPVHQLWLGADVKDLCGALKQQFMLEVSTYDAVQLFKSAGPLLNAPHGPLPGGRCDGLCVALFSYLLSCYVSFSGFSNSRFPGR